MPSTPLTSPHPLFVFMLEQPKVRGGTQNKLKTFFATSYKSHISKVENEILGKIAELHCKRNMEK